jgi:purine-binding chemotaxis protein CheW
MSPKRFRVDKTYFDKESLFPDEIIKPIQKKVMPKAEDVTLPVGALDVLSRDSERQPQEETNIINGTPDASIATNKDQDPTIFGKGDDANSKDSTRKGSRQGYQKYLTFQMGGQGYGLESFKVKEIVGTMKITPVPMTPDFVKGIVNLRGTVIPIVDLRVKLGFNEDNYTEKTCIIVVELTGFKGPVHIGIIVDSVSEVATINSDQIEEVPAFGLKLTTEYILGMAKLENGVNILLNIEKVLTEG